MKSNALRRRLQPGSQCDDVTLDVVLVLDICASCWVNDVDCEAYKESMKQLVRGLNVGENDYQTRVGIVKYGSVQHKALDMSSDIENIIQVISDHRCSRYTQCTRNT